jgi:hypothetical protein
MIMSGKGLEQTSIERLEEPLLRFNNTAATYGKVGLLEGSFSQSSDTHKNKINVGLIGRKDLVDRAKRWLERCNDTINSTRPKGSDPDAILNKRLFPDFPGAGISFGTQIVVPREHVQEIGYAELGRLDRKNKYEYVDGLLKLFMAKIERIIEENRNQQKPSVILCVIDNEMYEFGHAAGDYHAKLKKKKVDPNQLNMFQDFDKMEDLGYLPDEGHPFYVDLRSALKKRVMNPKIGLPIQLVREDTLKGDSAERQNDATIAWNLCAGVTYKAGNVPWVLDGFESRTCYVGLAFYHKKDFYEDDVFTSMAHIYRNNYDGMILRGEKAAFAVDEETGSKRPYLIYEQSKRLALNAIERFRALRDEPPRRVVVHKTSTFQADEIKGFSEVLESNGMQYDLISLRKSTFRIIRQGDYPVARGTYLEINDELAYLYSKGYIPELDTYPGVHIPAPFQVIKARGDSSIRALCGEILALTKLNWNTADFCSGLPITIGFASNVGRILREFDGDEGYEPRSEYKFYM